MSGLLSFVGIGILTLLRYAVLHGGTASEPPGWPEEDLVGIVGSMGASAVLLYGAPDAPFSQPRNLIGGHLLAGVIGVASYELFAVPLDDITLAAPLAVSISIMVMHATRTLHPPAGGTALIAVMGSQRMHDLGFVWVLVPVLTSALLMLVVALAGNNAVSFRSYPKYWR
jgi:CBS-domain-containing membrane protein